MMKYYFDKTVSGDFDKVIEKVKVQLRKEGFGVLTELNMKEIFKKKLEVEFKKYKILGTCNPVFAYKALSAENKIGTMLPCNIVVQELDDNLIEVAAINPLESMQAVINKDLIEIAQGVSEKLENVIKHL